MRAHDELLFCARYLVSHSPNLVKGCSVGFHFFHLFRKSNSLDKLFMLLLPFRPSLLRYYLLFPLLLGKDAIVGRPSDYLVRSACASRGTNVRCCLFRPQLLVIIVLLYHCYVSHLERFSRFARPEMNLKSIRKKSASTIWARYQCLCVPFAIGSLIVHFYLFSSVSSSRHHLDILLIFLYLIKAFGGLW